MDVEVEVQVETERHELRRLRPSAAYQRVHERIVSRRGWDRGRLVVAAAAVMFVLIGAANLELGPDEARTALAAREPIAPMGQTFGAWTPGVWPLRVGLAKIWGILAGGTRSDPGIVRWPDALAGVAIGLILSRRAFAKLGEAGGVAVALAWFGSVALIDRSAQAGVELVTACCVIGAVDRMIAGKADWVAGSWAALAFLAGGWPPVAIVLMVNVVLGRTESWLKPRLLIPPLLVIVGWSVWALNVAPAGAWAACLTQPFTMRSSWTLPLTVALLVMPFGPLAALTAFESIRAGWSDSGRAQVLGWLQAAGAATLAGTLIPGVADAARMLAVAGVLVAAGAVSARLWERAEGTTTRRWAYALAATLAAFWLALATAAGGYLAFTVAYYRTLAIVVIGLAAVAAMLAASVARRDDPRRAALALVVIAVALKLAHWGYFTPEWNYRRGQGPWGRAIGRWVPPRWPIYVFHEWPADLALATDHPVRRVADAKLLEYQSKQSIKFMLLLADEFAHWPTEGAPSIIEVARLQDEHGDERVVARTAGSFSWRDLLWLEREPF